MGIQFEKWQGLGNDFIILKDDIATSDLAVKMCDRNFGVGADGLFCPTQSEKADIGWKFFNSDGTIAQMCGNGIRCFAKYVRAHNLVTSNKFSVETLAGIITPEILENGNVLVDMGEPILEASKIPINVENSLDFQIQGFDAIAISMGNPHCVIYCAEDSEIQARAFGPMIEVDPIFPEKTNVEFVNIISTNRIKMNVWERGCGITLACGTGACASVVAGVKKNLINRICDVVLPGGVLNIEYKEDNHVYMQGDAKLVFEGNF
ncbi:diaminopimelate epimerase [bacterium]|nr:diaminopimelate epimerase [bacterium]